MCVHMRVVTLCTCAYMCVHMFVGVCYRQRIFQYSFCHPGLPLCRQSLNIVIEKYTESPPSTSITYFGLLEPAGSTNMRSNRGRLEISPLLPCPSHTRHPDILTNSQEASLTRRRMFSLPGPRGRMRITSE